MPQSTFRMRTAWACSALAAVLLGGFHAPAQDPSQDPSQGDPVGTDVFSVAMQGGEPGPGPGPTIFIPPTGGSGTPGQAGSHVPNINIPRIFGKSNDPCNGRFSPVTARQYFEMAAHPNQWLCAANGVSPGVHRVCTDLTELPGKCYDPNHQPPMVQHVVQNCLDINTQCGQLLHQENCADLYRLQAELRAGVQFPAPGPPANALTNWTPLYIAQRLPDELKHCEGSQLRGLTPKWDTRKPTEPELKKQTPALAKEPTIYKLNAAFSEGIGGLGTAPVGNMWLSIKAPQDGRQKRLIEGQLNVLVPVSSEARRNWWASGGVPNAQAFYSAYVSFDNSGTRLTVNSLTSLSGREITPDDFARLRLPRTVTVP